MKKSVRRGEATTSVAAGAAPAGVADHFMMWRRHIMTATGAGEGIRTLDPNLGKVVLYP